jgi:hypothetical protein
MNFLSTSKGKVSLRSKKYSNGMSYFLPLYFDESKDYFYYYDQSPVDLDMKPLVGVKKITGDFKKDVLENFSHINELDRDDLEYIMQFKN